MSNGKLPDGDMAFRILELKDALPLEQQVLLKLFEGALDDYTEIAKVKNVAVIQFVNYLSAQGLVMALSQQVELLTRHSIALQLERRQMLSQVIEQKETIATLGQELSQMARDLDDLRSDW